VSDGRIVGAEALLRWRHPERGEIPPAVFVPLAEETGAILPIGAWVLHEACAAAKRWHDDGHPDVRVAVNLSARQFLHGDVVGAVREALDANGLPAESLEIEITESIAMQGAAQVLATFQRLCDLGVRIAIDDFGTGYSSLDRLKRFPIHTLKVAQPFMDGVSEDEDSAAIVTTIIVLAKSLKLNVVAEGVESEEQLAFLRGQGCNEMQGYLFSRAVTSEAFLALLKGQGTELATPAPLPTKPAGADDLSRVAT
jgi:EAL domain-containing protein (putative c-di-GMP-specific phosphodiesterase class I)